MFLGLWRGVNPERLACLQGRPLHRRIDAACILEQESPADARVTPYAWQRHHSKMAASYHLGFYRTANRPSAIRSDDPENHNLEPNVKWIGCTVCEIFVFNLYCDLETRVWGHSRSSKAALFDRAHTTLYSSSIVNMLLPLTVSET